jgi:carboxyl-terminal processing protease
MNMKIKLKEFMKKSIIWALFFASGLFVGQYFLPAAQKVYAMKNLESTNSSLADFDPFWKAWVLLQENYESSVKISSTTTASTTNLFMPTDQEKVWGAIKGLTASYGDPYTTFFDPEETKSFNDSIRGEFEGVGMEVNNKDGILTVVAPLKNTPADRGGIKPNDKIIKIDGASTEGMGTEKAVSLIKGKKGTTVTLSIFRESEKKAIEIKLVRDRIESPILETEIKDGVFIIKLYSFSENSAKLFEDAIMKFSKSGSGKLVLDLRNNPGGYLDAAVSMASWFLPEGKIVVKEIHKNKAEKDFRSVGYNQFTPEFKFVILVNEGSASAAEILAAALSEYGKATLVGQKTFGKGTVQQLLTLTPDTAIKITIAKWLTPNGVSISSNGVEPQVKVEITEEDKKNNKDTQLEKAIQILNNK